MIFIGDVHGLYLNLMQYIDLYCISDTTLICVGDFGAGIVDCSELNNQLEKLKIQLYVVRGNHDMKYMFDGHHNLSNITFVPDGTLLNIEDNHILCIGGATSIDKEYRKLNNLPYEEEDEIDYSVEINYEELPSNLIVVSHCAPTFCEPFNTDSFFADFPNQKDSIIKERDYLANLYSSIRNKVTHWYYGHYHFSRIDLVNTTKFRLLNVLEFYEH